MAAAPPPPHSPMPTIPLRSHRVVGVVVVRTRAFVAVVVWESLGEVDLFPFLVRFRFPFLVLVRFGCVRENFLQTRPSLCPSPNSGPPMTTPLCDPSRHFRALSCFPFSVQILSRAILMKLNRLHYLLKKFLISKKKRGREEKMKSVREMK